MTSISNLGWASWADCPSCGISSESRLCVAYNREEGGYGDIACACGFIVTSGQVVAGTLGAEPTEAQVAELLVGLGRPAPDGTTLVLPPEERRWTLTLAPVGLLAGVEQRVSSMTFRFRPAGSVR